MPALILLAAAIAYVVYRRLTKALPAPPAAPAKALVDVTSCRSAVPVEPGLKPYKSGHMYGGADPTHLAYLRGHLALRAEAASGEDRRRILAFLALQGREGSTAAINTYDNQILTWGTGWGGLGMLGSVLERLRGSEAFVKALAACGVRYVGHGEWEVDDGSGKLVKGKRPALELIKATPALLHLLIHLARDPATRDAVTDAQLDAFKATSGNLPGSETIATQALFTFAAHLKHWAPGYMDGVLAEADRAVPGSPSPERDRLLAPEIVKGFYRRAKGWIPDWRQLQGYVRDMKADGLDVTGDPILSAGAPPIALA
jgi:hypothetical protein